MRTRLAALAIGPVVALLCVAGCGSSSKSGSSGGSGSPTSSGASLPTGIPSALLSSAGVSVDCQRLVSDLSSVGTSLVGATDPQSVVSRLQQVESTLTADASKGSASLRSAVSDFNTQVSKALAAVSSKDYAAAASDEGALASAATHLATVCTSGG